MNEKGIVIIADNIRSLENVGSLFRTGDAVGVKEILCVGISGYPDMGEKDTRRPYLRAKQHQMLSKTALSGIHIPCKYFPTMEECLQYVHTQGLYIVVVEQDDRSVDLFSNFEIRYPYCVVMGNEVTGVSKEFLEVADVIVEIPMMGKGKSLNVSVCAGIVLYRIMK